MKTTTCTTCGASVTTKNFARHTKSAACRAAAQPAVNTQALRAAAQACTIKPAQLALPAHVAAVAVQPAPVAKAARKPRHVIPAGATTYEQEGARNEHSDGHHAPGTCAECPECNPALNGPKTQTEIILDLAASMGSVDCATAVLWGCSKGSAGTLMADLCKAGKLVKLARGIYGWPKAPAQAVAA